jgi:transglutaminase-like putative cysteine protease
MVKLFHIIPAFILLTFISFAGSPADLIKKSGSASDYPGSNVLVIFDSTIVHMDSSGLSRVITHRLCEVLTAKGALTLNVVKYDYDPLSAYIEICGVNIYRADGSVEKLDETNVLDYPAPARMIYWGAREKMIDVGRLEPGDAVEVTLFRKGFTYALLADDDERYIPPMHGQFYDIVPFWSSDPVLEKAYEVSVPINKPLQYEFYNGEVSSKVRRSGDRMVYTFSKKDIAPFKSEPRMVDLSDVAPELILTTSPDWKSKSVWFYGVNQDFGSFNSTPAIKKKVSEILKNAHNEQDSISILTHWVADEIRYSGISMGKGEGYTLHKGEMDFTDRCGVCKDKAGMLITMLRAAGFESYPAMTMAGSRIDNIPADQFNHCVTVVKTRDKQYHLLDPTWVPFLRELWSSAEQQQNYLMGLPEGADLAITPLSDPWKHYLRINGISEILPDGTLQGEYTVTAEGQTDASIRGIFTRSFRQEWRSAIEKEILRMSPMAKILEISYDDPWAYLAGPINIHMRLQIPDFALVTDNEILFTPLVASHFFRRGMPHLSFETDLMDRKYNFRDRTSHSVELVEKIKLPLEYSPVYLPDQTQTTGTGASSNGGYNLNGDTLNFNFSSSFNKRIYEPSDWPSFREAVKVQNNYADSPVILIRK